METPTCFQPPSYRLAVASRHQMTSRQSTTGQPRPDMTSHDVYRVESRGVSREVPAPHTASMLNGRIFDEDRFRRLVAPKLVDRDTVGTMYQRPTARPSRPLTAATSCSLPREWAYDSVQERAGSTATWRLFSPTSHHPEFHESSNSAPADCTALRKPPRAVLLPCGPGVRATKVSARTKYHFTSTRRPAVMSSSVKDGPRSRSSSTSQQGACLWVGEAQTIDIRPVSAVAYTATVDCNNRKLNYISPSPD